MYFCKFFSTLRWFICCWVFCSASYNLCPFCCSSSCSVSALYRTVVSLKPSALLAAAFLPYVKQSTAFLQTAPPPRPTYSSRFSHGPFFLPNILPVLLWYVRIIYSFCVASPHYFVQEYFAASGSNFRFAPNGLVRPHT